MTARRIESDHAVFNGAAYRRDLTLFNVLDRAIRPTAWLLLSDGETYIIARNRADLAAWVWTQDDIPEHTVQEIADQLRVHFAGRKAHFTAKTPVAGKLESVFEDLGYHVERSMGLLAYRLDTLADTRPVGITRPAQTQDTETLYEYLRNFHYDCFGKELVVEPPATLQTILTAHLDAYTVLELDGAIAGFVRVMVNEPNNAIVVNQVYTHPDFRGRGCAKHLVRTAIAPYIDQGMHAVLYADSANPFSNAAYQGIGFVLQGEVLELEMTQEERNP